MDKRPEEQARRVARERSLFLYGTAAERGDLDTMIAVLREAEGDPVLEEMILEMNEVYRQEYEQEHAAVIRAEDVALVQRLLQVHLPSAFAPDAEVAMPPLTVGDVVARLKADAALEGRDEQEAAELARRMETRAAPLPEDLSRGGVRRLFEQLGVAVGSRFQELFRETALFLNMGRRQGAARLAATRRQQQARAAGTPPIHGGTTPGPAGIETPSIEAQAGIETSNTASDIPDASGGEPEALPRKEQPE